MRGKERKKKKEIEIEGNAGACWFRRRRHRPLPAVSVTTAFQLAKGVRVYKTYVSRIEGWIVLHCDYVYVT